MLFVSQSAAVFGINANLVDVEVDYVPLVAESDRNFQVIGRIHPGKAILFELAMAC